IRCQTNLDKVISQLVVFFGHRFIFTHHPGKFDTHTENRHCQHETSIVKMLLIGNPEKNPALEIVPRIKCLVIFCFWGRHSYGGAFSFIINITAHLHLLLFSSCFSLLLGQYFRRRTTGWSAPSTSPGCYREENWQQNQPPHYKQSGYGK